MSNFRIRVMKVYIVIIPRRFHGMILWVFLNLQYKMISNVLGLIHWVRVAHTCASKLTIIGSDNGLSPARRQAIIWNNTRIVLIWPIGTNFSETLSKIHIFSFKKMHSKMSSAKCRSFGIGLNVLTAFHTLHNARMATCSVCADCVFENKVIFTPIFCPYLYRHLEEPTTGCCWECAKLDL